MVEYFNLLVLLTMQFYIILNPPSVVAVMLGLTAESSLEERLELAKRVCKIGGILLFVFSLIGNFILDEVFQISTEAFRVGGGSFLFLVGLSMLISKEQEASKEDIQQQKTKDIFTYAVTPLSTPLLVGPGTITAVLVKRAEMENFGQEIVFFVAIIAAMLLVVVTFIFGCKFSKYFTPAILHIIEKMVGLLLICIAIKSIMAGMSTFIDQL